MIQANNVLTNYLEWNSDDSDQQLEKMKNELKKIENELRKIKSKLESKFEIIESKLTEIFNLLKDSITTNIDSNN